MTWREVGIAHTYLGTPRVSTIMFTLLLYTTRLDQDLIGSRYIPSSFVVKEKTHLNAKNYSGLGATLDVSLLSSFYIK